ncbi:MAG: cyclic nucleotide-binding domain-containing protein [Peptococcaceae bacterium]|nr:cyclic nucleotide-binding domain-containing protein [Peptococcaceae bacterium]
MTQVIISKILLEGETIMDRKELCGQLLERLPFQTMEVKRKSFCTLSFGQGGYVWILRKGLLMSVRNTEEGRYKALGVFDAPSLIGVGGLRQATRHITAYTLSKSVLSFARVKDFLALLYKDIDICYNFMLYISASLLDSYNDLEINTLGTLEDRVRAFEEQIATKKLPKDASLSEVITAMAVGAHPGSISRIRKQQKRGANVMESEVGSENAETSQE